MPRSSRAQCKRPVRQPCATGQVDTRLGATPIVRIAWPWPESSYEVRRARSRGRGPDNKKARVDGQGLGRGAGDESRTRALSLEISGSWTVEEALTCTFAQDEVYGYGLGEPYLTAVVRSAGHGWGTPTAGHQSEALCWSG